MGGESRKPEVWTYRKKRKKKFAAIVRARNVLRFAEIPFAQIKHWRLRKERRDHVGGDGGGGDGGIACYSV